MPDDETVLRRIRGQPSMLVDDPLTHEIRPSTGAFAVKRDEDGLSVYRESRLQARGLTAASVMTAPGDWVAGLAVVDVGAIPPLDVRDDPWPARIPDAAHPRNAAHALIVGLGRPGEK